MNFRYYSGLFTDPSDENGYSRACPLAKLAEDEYTVTRVEGRLLILTVQAGSVRAINALCPHQAGNLTLGELLGNGEETLIECPIHQWRFCLQSGKIHFPAHPEFALEYFPCLVRDGWAWVKLEQALPAVAGRD